MIKLNANGMKIMKLIHLVLIMMWLVGSMAMCAMFFVKPHSGDELFMLLTTINFMDWYFVIPGALATLIVGIIYGTFSNWGFFKYKWLIVKWILSIAVITIGTVYFSPHLEHAIALTDNLRDAALGNTEVAQDMHLAFVSSAVVCMILLILVTISVFKPWKGKKKQKA